MVTAQCKIKMLRAGGLRAAGDSSEYKKHPGSQKLESWKPTAFLASLGKLFLKD